MDQSQLQLLNELNAVLQIKNHPGWSIIMRDAQANFDAISYTWFNHAEGSADLKEAMVKQQANQIILSLMDRYEARLNEVGYDVLAKENSDLIQTTDVDNNGIEEEDE